jgi:RND family efflux transporter MFP subunit
MSVGGNIYMYMDSATGQQNKRTGARGSFLAVLLMPTLLLPTLAAAQGMPPTLVVTAEVTTGPVTEEVTLAGTVAPIRDSLIASEISGRVLERRVEKGDAVGQGDPLIIMDRKRLERDLAEAEAGLAEVEARLALARRQEKRAEDLLSSEVIAERFLDDARTERVAQEARKAQVKARIGSIQDDLERSIIRAPFGGVVTEIHTEDGEWIEISDPVVRLADFDTIEITVDLPERYYSRISRGDPAPATLDALPELTIDGKVFVAVPRAGSAARTFPVLVRAPNPGHMVGGGMLARVTLVLSSSDAVLRVPKDAIVRQQGGSVVYRLDGDTVAVVPVQTGRSNGVLIEVAGELEAGDQVVVRGNERIMPGQKVRVDESVTSASGSL